VVSLSAEMELSVARASSDPGNIASADESMAAAGQRSHSPSSLVPPDERTPVADIAGEAPAPGVAVIIAAFNAEATIKAAIHSALCQLEVVEVVVVDDGSPDRTGEVARGCDDGARGAQAKRPMLRELVR